jgi:hypothetical protein
MFTLILVRVTTELSPSGQNFKTLRIKAEYYQFDRMTSLQTLQHTSRPSQFTCIIQGHQKISGGWEDFILEFLFPKKNY